MYVAQTGIHDNTIILFFYVQLVNRPWMLDGDVPRSIFHGVYILKTCSVCFDVLSLISEHSLVLIVMAMAYLSLLTG